MCALYKVVSSQIRSDTRSTVGKGARENDFWVERVGKSSMKKKCGGFAAICEIIRELDQAFPNPGRTRSSGRRRRSSSSSDRPSRYGVRHFGIVTTVCQGGWILIRLYLLACRRPLLPWPVFFSDSKCPDILHPRRGHRRECHAIPIQVSEESRDKCLTSCPLPPFPQVGVGGMGFVDINTVVVVSICRPFQ